MVALVMTILYTLYTVACATDPVSYKGLFSVSKLWFDFSGTLRISSVGVVPRKTFWMVLLCSSMFPTINCEFVVFESL